MTHYRVPKAVSALIFERGVTKSLMMGVAFNEQQRQALRSRYVATFKEQERRHGKFHCRFVSEPISAPWEGKNGK